jgi:hypothetical protein
MNGKRIACVGRGSSTVPGATAGVNATCGSALLSALANSPRSIDRALFVSSAAAARASRACLTPLPELSVTVVSYNGVGGTVYDSRGAPVRLRNAPATDRACAWRGIRCGGACSSSLAMMRSDGESLTACRNDSPPLPSLLRVVGGAEGVVPSMGDS